MTPINFITLSVSLFLVTFVLSTHLNNKNNALTFIHLLDLVPFAILVGSSSAVHFMSDYTILKYALAAMFFTQTLYLFLSEHFTKSKTLTLSIASAALFIVLSLIGPWITISLIHIFLALFFLTSAFMLHKKAKASDLKFLKERSEMNIIMMLALVTLVFANTLIIANFGVVLLILFQISTTVSMLKHDRTDYAFLVARLEQLELQFNRAVQFEAKKRTATMTDHMDTIREKTIKDELTGALNRLGITQEINKLTNDSTSKIFSIALFDIDSFKEINDNLGHIVGDQALIKLTKTVSLKSPKNHFVGRYGGDEFILIMPGTNAPRAFKMCESIRQEVTKSSNPKISISVGIATYPFDGRDFTELMHIADKGLYKAKDAGKNTVKYSGNVPLLDI